MGSQSRVMRALLLLFSTVELAWWGYDLQGFTAMIVIGVAVPVLWFGFPAHHMVESEGLPSFRHIRPRNRLVLELMMFTAAFLAAKAVHTKWLAYTFALLVVGIAIEKRKHLKELWNTPEN